MEYTGIYREKPLPTLTLLQKDRRANINPHLLLVGFGKWGAESVIEDLEKKMDTSLDRHTNHVQRKATVRRWKSVTGIRSSLPRK